MLLELLSALGQLRFGRGTRLALLGQLEVFQRGIALRRGLAGAPDGLRKGDLARGERCLVIDQVAVTGLQRSSGLVERLLRVGELCRAVLGCWPLRSLLIGGLRLLQLRGRLHVATGDHQDRRRRDCTGPVHRPPPVPRALSFALASSASARVACSRVSDLASAASAWALSSLRAATAGSSLLSLFAASS